MCWDGDEIIMEPETSETRQRQQTATASSAENKESTTTTAKKKSKAAEKAEKAAAERVAAEKPIVATEKKKTLTTPAHATRPKPESAVRQQARRNVREQVGELLTPAYDDDDVVFHPRSRSASNVYRRRGSTYGRNPANREFAAARVNDYSQPLGGHISRWRQSEEFSEEEYGHEFQQRRRRSRRQSPPRREKTAEQRIDELFQQPGALEYFKKNYGASLNPPQQVQQQFPPAAPYVYNPYMQAPMVPPQAAQSQFVQPQTAQQLPVHAQTLQLSPARPQIVIDNVHVADTVMQQPQPAQAAVSPQQLHTAAPAGLPPPAADDVIVRSREASPAASSTPIAVSPDAEQDAERTEQQESTDARKAKTNDAINVSVGVPSKKNNKAFGRGRRAPTVVFTHGDTTKDDDDDDDDDDAPMMVETTSTSDESRGGGKPRYNFRLPTFGGKKFHVFKVMFESAAEDMGWNEKQKCSHLVHALRDEPQELIASINRKDWTTKGLMDELERAYVKNKSYATVQTELYDMRRKPDQTIYHFAAQIQSAARQADITDEEREWLMRSAFVLGLSEYAELRSYIERKCGEKRDFKTAVDLALQFERERHAPAPSRLAAQVSAADSTASAEVNRFHDVSSQQQHMAQKQQSQISDPVVKKLQQDLAEMMEKMERLTVSMQSSGKRQFNPRYEQRTSSESRADTPGRKWSRDGWNERASHSYDRFRGNNRDYSSSRDYSSGSRDRDYSRGRQRYRGRGGSRQQRVTYTAFYPQPQQYGAAIRPMEQAQEQAAPAKSKKGKAAQPSQQVAFQQPPQIIISEARQDSYSDAESFDEHTDQE